MARMRAPLLLALFAAIASEQSPPAQAPPVFRSGAHLVQVNVVVHDKRGEPIADLKKEDFTIFERGKPQEIGFFSVDTAGPSPKAARAQADAPQTPLPSRTFTNIASAHADLPTGVTVILIDILNAPPGDQMRARDGVIKFLRQLQSQDRIAIFALTSHGLALLHDYTTDSAALVERLRNAKPQVSTELSASLGDPGMQAELRAMGLDGLADADQRTADIFMANRINQSLAAFRAVAEHLAGLPGRKNLVWVSSGFPLSVGFDEMPQVGAPLSERNPQLFTQEMEGAIRVVNDNGIAVYPVDARGVFNPVVLEADIRGPNRRDFGKMPSTTSTSSNTSTMFVLADKTGGRVAYNTNDLGGAVRRAIDDGRVTYTLGYYSTDAKEDGTWRDIKVDVRRPGVDVRARKGYYAMRATDQSADARMRQIRAGVWSPLESTALPITAEIDFRGDAPNAFEVNVELDPRIVGFNHEGDRWKAGLDMVFVQKDAQGAQLGEGGMDNVSIALTEENYKKVLEQGVIHRYRGARQPSAKTLRIVVRDATTGAVGSVTIPFGQVPKPGGLRP
jgi:VWFA-related protein